MKRCITGMEALWRPLSSRNSPSVLRSSGTRQMPARMACEGDKTTASTPSTRSVPPLTSAMPKQARNKSRWPMPCRPATPKISPACREKEADCSLPEVARSCAPSTSVPRALPASARAALLCSSLRPTIISMTCASVKSDTAPLAMCWPLRNTVMLSQKLRTSGRRWVIKTTVTPLRFCAAMSSPIHCTSVPESVEVDSSSKRMRGSRNSARAISNFC